MDKHQRMCMQLQVDSRRRPSQRDGDGGRLRKPEEQKGRNGLMTTKCEEEDK